MAREVKKFGLKKSEAMDKIESIYEQGQTTQQPAPSMPSAGTGNGNAATSSTGSQQPSGEAQHPLSMQPLKTEKSVKVTIPMDYYFRLARLKECTGKTLQELAAQGVIEFIDRYSKC